jgi:hypothetical protein
LIGFTVSKVGSNATWNCGLTKAVSLSITSATFRPCCGDLPK